MNMSSIVSEQHVIAVEQKRVIDEFAGSYRISKRETAKKLGVNVAKYMELSTEVMMPEHIVRLWVGKRDWKAIALMFLYEQGWQRTKHERNMDLAEFCRMYRVGYNSARRYLTRDRLLTAASTRGGITKDGIARCKTGSVDLAYEMFINLLAERGHGNGSYGRLTHKQYIERMIRNAQANKEAEEKAKAK